MTIVVLDFDSNSVDYISVDKEFVDKHYNGEVDEFLVCWCGYSISDCNWMVGGDTIEENHFTLDNFAGDDELELNEEDDEEIDK